MTTSDKNRKAEEYATNNPDFGGLLNIIYKYLTPETVQTLQLAFKQTYLAGYEAGQKDWAPVIELVNQQAEDEGLWVVPALGTQPIMEAYLQQELRRLHALIESIQPPREVKG